MYSPSCSLLVLGLSQLNLHPVDAVHAVHEQDQDEYEGYLLPSASCPDHLLFMNPTFNPYCNFATNGFSEMKVKRPRFTVKGSGMMSDMKTLISKTRRAKTCVKLR